jgi:hypothetical protein
MKWVCNVNGKITGGLHLVVRRDGDQGNCKEDILQAMTSTVIGQG